MASIFNSFESPTSGTALAGGNGSNVDGSTAWSSVSIGAAGTLVTDTAHIGHGSQSLKVATGATAAVTYAMWSTLGPFNTGAMTIWGRYYMYFTANPSASLKFCQPLSAVNGTSGQFVANTTGKIVIQDAAGTTQGTSTNSIALNQLIRVEMKVVISTTVGVVEAKLFNSAESTTATETITGTALNTGTDPVTQVRIGQCAANANVGPVWYDDVMFSDVAYPGPVSVGSVLSSAGFFAA